MNLREMLQVQEGLRLKPYYDINGYLSIGYGRNLTTRGISQIEAETMLDNDIETHKKDLSIHLPWTNSLDEPRRNVLINMCFNLGIGSLLKFHDTLESIQRGAYKEAAQHMLDSNWAAQVGSRADYLAKIMETGEE